MVSNACYATDQKRRTAAGAGGDPYMPTLLLTTRREEDHAEVRIRDNGSGMPPEVIEKIFNPFFTTKPANEGTGLGLAMSSDIVRKHGGAIRVESEPDRFTEMIVEMPLTPPSTVLVEEEETAAVAAQGDGPPPEPAI
jgi:signal transduction histidine kinase